jgi:hypothetical protein
VTTPQQQEKVRVRATERERERERERGGDGEMGKQRVLQEKRITHCDHFVW